MRDECLELQKQAVKLEKKKLTKEPYEVIEVFRKLGLCYFEHKYMSLGFENYVKLLLLITNHKEREKIIYNMNFTELTGIFQKIIEHFENNHKGLKSTEIDSLIELVHIILEYNKGNIKYEFLIAEILYNLTDKALENGLIEKAVYQTTIGIITELAEDVFLRGQKRLEKTDFVIAQEYFSMTAILFQLITDPKMDLAFKECAKANLLQGKYLVTKKKYLKGLDALIAAVKIYQVIELFEESENGLIIIKKAFRAGINYFEDNYKKDDPRLKKLLLFEEVFKDLERSQKKTKQQGKSKENIIVDNFMRIPYPKTMELIDEKATKNQLEKELYTLEQSLESINHAFRDGLISSEDYARLLLGLNRNIYKVRSLLEKKK
ncbi:MAG: hypothetical protein HGN29_14970 [Asgard group archaeon]|nr:hypothetical protein [Asgard group archaeon]